MVVADGTTGNEVTTEEVEVETMTGMVTEIIIDLVDTGTMIIMVDIINNVFYIGLKWAKEAIYVTGDIYDK
ncbi:hypothetical protein NQ317_002322 [Molorchus minor]|uniref:Uncharacterized protein n=1 Tax=Molorchus minor TaxID=1323400 RepID=A0ABQ9J4N5_9CUCU|nr:hypothetical protein NQ317_002322 [Molorchus minor]